MNSCKDWKFKRAMQSEKNTFEFKSGHTDKNILWKRSTFILLLKNNLFAKCDRAEVVEQIKVDDEKFKDENFE